MVVVGENSCRTQYKFCMTVSGVEFFWVLLSLCTAAADDQLIKGDDKEIDVSSKTLAKDDDVIRVSLPPSEREEGSADLSASASAGGTENEPGRP